MDGHFLAHIMDFCHKAEAELTILSVFESPGQSVMDYFKSQQQDLKDLILTTHKTNLAKAMEQAKLDKDSVKTVTRWGKDFIETIKLVQGGGYDLLISAPHEPGKAPDSTSMHFLRKCPCPVWINQGALWKGSVRILAAVNAADSSDSSHDLDRKILDCAIWLSGILRGHLHVVHCWKGYGESVLNSPRFSQDEAAKYIEFEKTQNETRMAQLMEKIDLPHNAKSKVIYGYPGDVIPQYAADKMIDIVVMGSVARTGIPGLLIGNTAEKIVGNLDCSVLAIKPDGFVSPVR